MAAINPTITSSYYFTAEANERFAKDLDAKLIAFNKPNSNIVWWNAKNLARPLHCSIGVLDAPDMSTKEKTELNEKLQKKTIQKLAGDEAIFNKIEGFDITANGAVILKFKPNQPLKDLHERFMNSLEKEGLDPGKFTHKDYLPHVTIGCMKRTGSKANALLELEAVLKVIKKNPFPFIVYDMSLIFSQQTIHGFNSERVVHIELNRRTDMGVLGTGASKHNPKDTIVFVDTKDHAEKLANTLASHYKIQSAGNSKNPKTVTTVKKTNGTLVNTLRLTHNEFAKVKGHFENLA